MFNTNNNYVSRYNLGQLDWNNLVCVSPNSDDCLDLDQLKAQLRIYHNDDDLLLIRLIKTAQAVFEGNYGLGRVLLTQQWRLTVDTTQTPLQSLPNGFNMVATARTITIPLGKVQSVDSVTYVDSNMTNQTVDPSSYYYDTDLEPCKIVFKSLPSSPTVKVNFTAGYGDTMDSIPDDLQGFLYAYAADLYKNRDFGNSESARSVDSLPFSMRTILNKYKIVGVG